MYVQYFYPADDRLNECFSYEHLKLQCKATKAEHKIFHLIHMSEVIAIPLCKWTHIHLSDGTTVLKFPGRTLFLVWILVQRWIPRYLPHYLPRRQLPFYLQQIKALRYYSPARSLMRLLQATLHCVTGWRESYYILDIWGAPWEY